MAEELKGLIEKIQREGIQAAEEKAGQIEAQARGQAEEILRKAKLQADKMLVEAQEKIARDRQSMETTLEQSARDLLISLRAEIDAMLKKIIVSSLRQALTPEELARIISGLAKEQVDKKKQDVVISLNKDDLEKLEGGFLSELKESLKKGIALRPCDDIRAGFTISFDSGRSHFDFTDKALAEYISLYLKPKLNRIFKE